MADEQKPDALMIRIGIAKGVNIFQRMADLHSRFGPVLGVKKGFLFPATGSRQWHFYAPNLSDSILFPADHALAMQERYDWKDAEDGVKYGTLVPAARPVADSAVGA